MEAATTSAPQAAARPAERALPPGPPLPRIVQTAIWSRQARRMLYACQDRYGDMFSLKIVGEGTWVMLADPEAVKQVFTGDPRVFHAGEGNQLLEPLLGPHSLLVLDEKAHLSQRKLLLPAFHGKRMQAYEGIMTEIAEREIASWPTGTPYKLRPRMQALTLEIILRTVFGAREGEGLADLRDALRHYLALLTDPRQLLPVIALGGPKRIRRLPWFRRAMDRVDELIYREIAARRQAEDLEERDDVLSLLTAARHEDGSPMSDEEMRDELLTLLTAGHETTATSLSWAVERLARHPGKLERLRAEVEAGGEEYLAATILETLRLRPTIAIVLRRLAQPVEIGGYELPAGVAVVPSVYLVHRNPQVYPEPDRFLPERFLENPPGTYTWIPFGGGVRRCLGGAFAHFEMTVVLRELVKRHGIRPADPEPEAIYRRAITETPRHDAEVILG
ncbi:MAG TPA: cytochrome P450 [Solirubrobacterales bacterium]|jgi:cytochrome P450|nr:cytochrome P450 [Solirubrobacterales bacterium]